MRVSTILAAALVLVVSPALAAPVAQGGKSSTPFPLCLLTSPSAWCKPMTDVTQV